MHMREALGSSQREKKKKKSHLISMNSDIIERDLLFLSLRNSKAFRSSVPEAKDKKQSYISYYVTISQSNIWTLVMNFIGSKKNLIGSSISWIPSHCNHKDKSQVRFRGTLVMAA